MDTPQYSLRWNNHLVHMMDAIEVLLQNETLVDVTLVCEKTQFKAHKVVLSACRYLPEIILNFYLGNLILYFLIISYVFLVHIFKGYSLTPRANTPWSCLRTFPTGRWELSYISCTKGRLTLAKNSCRCCYRLLKRYKYVNIILLLVPFGIREDLNIVYAMTNSRTLTPHGIDDHIFSLT